MKHRKLRIAWSAAWGLVAVLMCVLWVRSYWYESGVIHVESRDFTCVFVKEGSVWCRTDTGDEGSDRFLAFDAPIDPMNWAIQTRARTVKCGCVWWGVIVASALSVAPWLHFRFSLRTLLIATTLVAMGLGVVI